MHIILEKDRDKCLPVPEDNKNDVHISPETTDTLRLCVKELDRWMAMLLCFEGYVLTVRFDYLLIC